MLKGQEINQLYMCNLLQNMSDQRLIYSGHLLKDNCNLISELRGHGSSPESRNFVLHLVCAPSSTQAATESIPNTSTPATTVTGTSALPQLPTATTSGPNSGLLWWFTGTISVEFQCS